MCGIAGYVGEGNAVAKIFEMLKRLEYRGYDSAGIAFLNDGLEVIKDQGKVDEVKKKASLEKSSKIALGHSRWATHGPPSRINAHPHTDCKKEIAIVHNGIIENYSELTERLKKQGHKFSSETDTETITHLIEENLSSGDFEEAFVAALNKLEGSFAVLAVYEKEPEKIFFARNESPLLIGLGKDANFLASDMPAILPETKKAVFLDDGEYGFITKESFVVKDLKTRSELKKEIHVSTLSVESAEKGGYEHFMLKEIIEESAAVRNATKSKEAIEKAVTKIKDDSSIYLVACGTAWHAAVVARYILQEYGIPASSEVASEFRYSTAKSLCKGDTVILVSQSGETADTIAAAKEAKKRGAHTIAVVNALGSSLTRIADETLHSYSGPEIAVASTKAYLGQATVLTLLVLSLIKSRGGISEREYADKLKELQDIPAKIDTVLDNREWIREVAKILENTNDYFYIARGVNYPTAMEGALKLKEISYLHAEAYPGGELKHGPLALMDKNVCVIAINPDNELRKKMSSNIQEIKSRGAKVVELIEGSVFSVANGDDIRVTLPKTDPLLTPLTMVVPLHILSYYIALAKGHNIDKPRNLAKSVTVE